MNCVSRKEELVERMRRALPLVAHARPPLLTFLRHCIARDTAAPRLTVTNVFDAGDAQGVMCQFAVHDWQAGRSIFVAPIAQIAFDRRHAISREIAARDHRDARRARIDR
jgi:hypothetical protein